MIKFHTIQKLPPNRPEMFSKPSLTRASEYESIESMFARFIGQGGLAPTYRTPTADERDVMDNSLDYADLEDEDLVVQKMFIDSVAEELEKKSKKKEVEQPTQEKPAPEKPATEPENASK